MQYQLSKVEEFETVHTSHSQQVVGIHESYLYALLQEKQTAKMAERLENVSF